MFYFAMESRSLITYDFSVADVGSGELCSDDIIFSHRKERGA